MGTETPTHVPEHLRRSWAAADLLHQGPILRCAAEEVLEQLPTGSLVLVATSVEGAALAATCAALATARDITWQYFSPLWPATASADHVVAVEASDPGDGWRHAVNRRFPDAHFIFPRLDT